MPTNSRIKDRVSSLRASVSHSSFQPPQFLAGLADVDPILLPERADVILVMSRPMHASLGLYASTLAVASSNLTIESSSHPASFSSREADGC
jgi:hypothetical protein